ncbi:MAG: hypothetical protein OXT49_05735 [Gammaproteobacteria bacterium]|nr:hypothetical protein [Gammaproteobacteria bacterium]
MQLYVFKMFQATAMVVQGYAKYSRAPNKIPYSVDDYVAVIGLAAETKINPLVVDKDVKWQPRAFKGQILKRGGEADILVPQIKSEGCPYGVTECEQRFAVIKEACHTLLNVENDFVDQLSSHVARVVTAGSSVVLNDLSPLLQDEYLGEVAAMELLLPFDKRDGYREQLERGDVTALDIAHRYKVPEKKVIEILSDEIHIGLAQFREQWMNELDNHVAGMQVPVVEIPPRRD